MSNRNEKVFKINSVQFFILGLLSLFILFDNIPVVIDAFNHKRNYRLHDGMGDGLKTFGYFIITSIVWLTMKFKDNKPDFIAVLLFDLVGMLCISAIGLYKFIALLAITIALSIYMFFSFIAKLKKKI